MSNTLLVPPPHQGPRIPYAQLLEHARATLPAHLPKKSKEILLALDIDGTLLLPEGASPRVKNVLHEALEAGVNVVIATGRGVHATQPVFEELELPDGFSVSANGAQTVHWAKNGRLYEPEILKEHVFDPRPAGEAILETVPDILLGVDKGAQGMLVTQRFPAREMLSAQRVVGKDELLATETPRMVARAPWMSRDEFDAVMHSVPLEDVSLAVGWTAWADICPGGISKATGLEELSQALGVPNQGTIALGDGTNDIEMLKWAGHGVAMGGATAEVRAAADATTGPVDFDGAAAVIEAVLERL